MTCFQVLCQLGIERTENYDLIRTARMGRQAAILMLCQNWPRAIFQA